LNSVANATPDEQPPVTPPPDSEIPEESNDSETHSTFEDYCKDRWDMGKRNAYQLIAASAVLENVRKCAQIEEPANEAQARSLTKLETPEKQQEAWEMVVETAPEGHPEKHCQN